MMLFAVAMLCSSASALLTVYAAFRAYRFWLAHEERELKRRHKTARKIAKEDSSGTVS